MISSLKEEPDWMLEFRLNAYEKFLKMKEPKWSDNQYPLIDFQVICYYYEFLYSFMIFLSLIFLRSVFDFLGLYDIFWVVLFCVLDEEDVRSKFMCFLFLILFFFL